jgi:peptidyl-prolyl cis-trans isomerase SurA
MPPSIRPHGRRVAAAIAAAALCLAGAVGAASAQGPAPAEARPGAVVGRIAAVVNDEPITQSALRAREDLVILGTGLPDTPETRERIRQQVLRNLVDEALQRQEARRQGVSVSDEDVSRGVATIAAQNRLSVGQLETMLSRSGIPISTMRDQVRASVAWSRLLQRRFRPQLDVGEEDVDEVLRRIEASIGQPEYLVAEIFLGVDRPDQDADVRGLAQRLAEQIRGGAAFADVARQFSQAAGAAQGGDLGWVQRGQLLEELERAVADLRPGEVTPPVRTATGWHILQLRDRRVATGGDPVAVEVSYRRVLVPSPPVADPFEILAQAERVNGIRRRIDGCDGLEQALGGTGAEIGAPVRAALSQLPRDAAELLRPLQPGQASAVVRTAEGSNILVLCARDEQGGGPPSRDRIRERLVNERLDMMARRLIRDLRRQAFVDVRI